MATAPYFDGTQPCLKVDPEIFFPELDIQYDENDKAIPSTAEEKARHMLAVRVAKTVCNDCSFSTPCLSYALENDVVGIWGATDEKERRSIRKRLKLKNPRSLNAITQEYVK